MIVRAQNKPLPFIVTSSAVCAAAASTGRQPLSTHTASAHSMRPSEAQDSPRRAPTEERHGLDHVHLEWYPAEQLAPQAFV